MAKEKSPMLTLGTLAEFDDDFTTDFAKHLSNAVSHCRDFPMCLGARKITIEIALTPSERDPQDQEVALASEVKYPTISAKVAKRRARSNKANQLMLDMDYESEA